MRATLLFVCGGVTRSLLCSFVKIMVDSLKSEIQESRNENGEIKKSLEFIQHQLAMAIGQ